MLLVTFFNFLKICLVYLSVLLLCYGEIKMCITRKDVGAECRHDVRPSVYVPSVLSIDYSAPQIQRGFPVDIVRDTTLLTYLLANSWLARGVLGSGPSPEVRRTTPANHANPKRKSCPPFTITHPHLKQDDLWYFFSV